MQIQNQNGHTLATEDYTKLVHNKATFPYIPIHSTLILNLEFKGPTLYLVLPYENKK